MKQKWDKQLFNGNVAQPIPMVIFAVLVGVALFVIALWATLDLVVSKDEIPITHTHCVIRSSIEDGPVYYLTSTTGTVFNIPSNISGIELVMNDLTNSVEGVRIEHYVPQKDADGSLKITAISDNDGIPILKREIILSARQKNTQIALVLLWSICCCYFLFFFGAYYILCNASKHPYLASILVRPSYRNF